MSQRNRSNSCHRERPTRRELLRAGTLALAGLSLPSWFALQARAAATGKAKHGIFVFLNGGPSQLDTFDLKPDAPDGIRGPYRPIATNVVGIRISEKLPRLAQVANKYAIVRSATHRLLAHNTGAAYALSGHSPDSDANIAPTPMDHPSFGVVLTKLRPSSRSLPSAVLMPRLLFDMGFPTPSAGGGWLGHAYDPFPVWAACRPTRAAWPSSDCGRPVAGGASGI